MSTNYKISDSGLDYILENEGLSLNAIYDNIGYSIGYGHFMGRQPKNHKPPLDNISELVADTLFNNDTLLVEKGINKANLILTQDQIDALADLGYNSGLGKLKKALNFLQNNDIDNCINWWQNCGTHDRNGKIINNNVKRRNYEIELMDFANFSEQNPSKLDKLGKDFKISRMEMANFNPSYIVMAGIIGWLLTKLLK